MYTRRYGVTLVERGFENGDRSYALCADGKDAIITAASPEKLSPEAALKFLLTGQK